jgi:ribosomal protein S27E
MTTCEHEWRGEFDLREDEEEEQIVHAFIKIRCTECQARVVFDDEAPTLTSPDQEEVCVSGEIVRVEDLRS